MKKIMDKGDIFRSLKRITHEIIEYNHGVDNIALLCIQRRGVDLGKIIADEIFNSEGVKVPFGILDITLYRDDFSIARDKPEVKGTEIDFDVNGKDIILIDDVLFTGRTVRAALDEIMDFGRPKSVQLAVLIDRGHKELPIMANFVGLKIDTEKDDIIKVKTEHTDSVWEVLKLKKEKE